MSLRAPRGFTFIAAVVPILTALMVLLPRLASAHHSPFVHYESRDLREIEGEVVGFEWRNPHTRFDVKETAKDGTVTIWNMEYSPPAILLRQGVTKDNFKAGTHLKFAGWKAKDSNTMFITNILFPDGTENYNDTYAPARWTAGKADKKVGEALTSYQDRKIQEAGGHVPDTLFRVWANDFNDRTPNKLFASAGDLPLTDFAMMVKAKWDPVKDNPYIFCRNGMPGVMDQVHPMEFVKDGANIRLRIEEYDLVRIIHMNGEAPPTGRKAGPLGYSVGRWDGGTLVVTTTRVDYPWFNKAGVPQSPDLTMVERFTMNPEKTRLDYTLTATDLKVFKAPVVMKRQWLWVPGEVVKPYHCQFNKSDLGVAPVHTTQR